MTDVEVAQAAALARCKFSPGSTAKRFVGWAAGLEPTRELTPKATAFLDRLTHQYRKQIGRCMSVACATCHAPELGTYRNDVRVGLDAFIEGRKEFADHLPKWRKAALAFYNITHGTTFAHPYEYATKVAPSRRRAETRGDIYCRFCGERLLVGIKQPHKLVADSAQEQRHLTICALQAIAGMREPAQPGHRALPLEYLWSEDDGLFATGRKL